MKRVISAARVQLLAKKAEAAFKMSLARRDSRTSRSSSVIRSCSAVVMPAGGRVDLSLAQPAPQRLTANAELTAHGCHAERSRSARSSPAHAHHPLAQLGG